jgi:UDP-N-acetylglucosamine--N-acetylmuramyl-(pentapeptide) pyrophosphoryl-undecaprenol N-acetylglucosamine transferase
VVPEAIARLPEGLRLRLSLSQQARADEVEAVRNAYARLGVAADVSAFFDDVPARLAGAHLGICRSGASTVAELAAAGRPAILVPYPFAADDHQTANARAMSDAGAAWIMPERALGADTLAERLLSLLAEPAALARAAACAQGAGHPDAAERLADLADELIRGNGAQPTEAAA